MTQLFAKKGKHEMPQTVRQHEIQKYLTEKIAHERPEEIHHSLVQAYARLQEMVEKLMAENLKIHQILIEEPIEVQEKVMTQIVGKSHDYLVTNYKGEYVALTFDGKVVEHSKSQIDLLNRIDNLVIPKNKIFVYSVPLA